MTDIPSTPVPFNETLGFSSSLASVNSTESYTPQECYSTAVIVIMATVMSFINVVIIVGNVTVILAFITDKRVRTLSNFLLLSLSCSDLLVGVIILPVSISKKLTCQWIFGPSFCIVWLSSDYVATVASTLSLCMITFDRYMTISRIHRYRHSNKTVVGMITVSWMVPISVYVPTTAFWDEMTGQVHIDPPGECNEKWYGNEIFTTTVTTFQTYIPLLLLMMFNVGIYYTIHKNSQKLKRSSMANKSVKNETEMTTMAKKGALSETTNRNTLRNSCASTSFSNAKPAKKQKNPDGKHKHHNDKTTFNDKTDVITYNKNDLVHTNSEAVPDANPEVVLTHFAETGTEQAQHDTLTVEDTKADLIPPSPRHTTEKGNGNGCNNSIATTIKVRLGKKTHHRKKLDQNSRVNTVEEPGEEKESSSYDELSEKEETKAQQQPVAAKVPKYSRASRKERRRFNRDLKVAKTIALLVGIYIICICPYSIIAIILKYCTKCRVSQPVFDITVWLVYSNSALNPILYIYRNRVFRRAIRQLYCQKTKQCLNTV